MMLEGGTVLRSEETPVLTYRWCDTTQQLHAICL